ncbi:thioredoxin domain-containing protein [Solitalea sp. MAHUQ-68]|uniref:Thioredoxin domain-containing protein n=1 Tax=Solitalea agri TaxID=2953739 RepID=A0A9X2JDL7_9SPHI|nr:thioredoxin domain-containing protein [Solitalea agri]MCO4293769.1 thioredoxin domain-containing protein [Solitalea agri]
MPKHTNALVSETSPYLLQHAHNPVNWFPWGAEALKKAKEENKLILVSVGYSACHWCHVMEHESFEDEEVAAIMNEHFVCVKVDREERPDIDQIYMNAVQLMTGGGGWPLNCFCLPDQRPFYGGTYFRKDDWKQLLNDLNAFYRNKPDEAGEYARRLHEGINQSDLVSFVNEKKEYTNESLKAIVDSWIRYFDFTDGGHNRAPKFPLPNNFLFLLRYAHLMKDQASNVITRITLDKMAYGGIYDQLGGGFARYSVDSVWLVPHFEKMLYDNAQLVSLYAEAYQYSHSEIYKKVVEETLEFVKRELTSPEGGFYSALDADSEGVEGKFYCWTKDELQGLLGDDEELFSIYYNVTEAGNWEETNILHRKQDDDVLAEALGITVENLLEIIERCKAKLMKVRAARIRPGLDDKILTSWNSMMLKAYVDAYRVFNNPEYLQSALQNAEFILSNLKTTNGGLKRNFKNGKATINGFLDDYAFTIEAFIELYQATFDEQWLNEAKVLVDYCNDHFIDTDSGMYFYTADTDEQLIARKMEVMDTVIPASNSAMARALLKLGILLQNEEYLKQSGQMLTNVSEQIKKYASAYSNWALLMLENIFPFYEVAITGKGAVSRLVELDQYYIPNKLVMGGETGTLPLLEGKINEQPKVYVCVNRTCLMPVSQVVEAVQQMKHDFPIV